MTKQVDTYSSQLENKTATILLLKKILPAIPVELFNRPFNEAGIDSMDLLQLRTELEKHAAINDKEWLSFHSLNDICNGIVLNSTSDLTDLDPTNPTIARNYSIDMPQMTLMALSEIWLLKETGNLHWELICKSLNCRSSELLDENKNRLYATFARIRYQSQNDLSEYRENDKLSLQSSLSRWGKNLYFSKASGISSRKNFSVELLSSFSVRNQADNTSLSKSQPNADASSIPELANYPLFAEEFKNLKRNQLQSILLMDTTVIVSSNCLFECDYILNPYSEINGVGLLYFAAYSGICDSCEAKYANAHKDLKVAYELTSYTLARDIFFFGNCNVNDSIVYRLHSFEINKDGIISSQSSLYRKSDDSLMARIFALKKWRQ